MRNIEALVAQAGYDVFDWVNGEAGANDFPAAAVRVAVMPMFLAAAICYRLALLLAFLVYVGLLAVVQQGEALLWPKNKN